MRLLVIIILLGTQLQASYSQIGGTSAYSFLSLPASAHVASLGGHNVSIVSNEPSFIFSNPSLITDSTQRQVFLTASRIFTDVFYGTVGLGISQKPWGQLFFGMQYVNFGNFARFDELGNPQGNFSAADYSLCIAYSKPFRNDSLWTYGFAIKPVFSQYESHTSFGIAFDAGLRYYHPEKLWSIALVLNNLGAMIKPYETQQNEPIRYDVKMGVSKKLKHAPLRLSVTFTNLNRWDLSDYRNESNNLLDTTKHYSKIQRWSDELLRHTVLGTDIVLSKNLYVAVGYNFQRRKELGTYTRLSMTGFSWGLGLKLYRFQLHYARASYHLAGATNTFSLSTRLSEWGRTKY
ncbi:MAG: type IX secretion system protein PorQ [Bacteroidales bacterium]|nr:type IX secretion system protein PorQ [Bacteroidales bacterium]